MLFNCALTCSRKSPLLGGGEYLATINDCFVESSNDVPMPIYFTVFQTRAVKVPDR